MFAGKTNSSARGAPAGGALGTDGAQVSPRTGPTEEDSSNQGWNKEGRQRTPQQTQSYQARKSITPSTDPLPLPDPLPSPPFFPQGVSSSCISGAL